MDNSVRKMTKNEFVSKYINDMYNKRRKQRYTDADSFLIESAINGKAKSDKKKGRGVLKYER